MARREVLAAISHHLAAAEGDIDTEAERTRVAIRRTQVRIEGLLGEPPRREGRPDEGPPFRHLEEADALAREHLGDAGLEGQIRRAVGEALSAAEEEL